MNTIRGHRVWFPFILIGLSLLLFLALVVIYQPEKEEKAAFGSLNEGQELPTDEEYQEQVNDILFRYESGESVKDLYQELISMIVPSEYRDIHLDLALAFAKLSSDSEEGIVLLDLLKSQVDWLE